MCMSRGPRSRESLTMMTGRSMICPPLDGTVKGKE